MSVRACVPGCVRAYTTLSSIPFERFSLKYYDEKLQNNNNQEKIACSIVEEKEVVESCLERVGF